MKLVTAAALVALLACAQPTHAQQAPHRFDAAAVAQSGMAQDTERVHAIEYSDAYATRLTIHRIGSYAALPLFVGQYLLGNELMNGDNPASWVKGAHSGVAIGLGALFVTNTVTGLWNLYDTRKEPAGRARRYLHTALMLAADAGFAYTGLVTAEDAGEREFGEGEGEGNAGDHRSAALVSMGIAATGTVMMWLWKD